MNEWKGDQITTELQNDKTTSQYSCPNVFFELLRPKKFFKILWQRECESKCWTYEVFRLGPVYSNFVRKENFAFGMFSKTSNFYWEKFWLPKSYIVIVSQNLPSQYIMKSIAKQLSNAL